MSLRFRYQHRKARQPVIPLGGRWVRPRPIFSVTIASGATLIALDSLLDTGSDDTVFPESVASRLGLDLSNAPTGEASGIGLATAALRYAEVTLRVSDGVENREWQAWFGFTALPLKQPLLGFAGFLQFFTTTFHGDMEVVELTPNRLYSGT